MTEHILGYDREVGTRAAENIALLSGDDQISLQRYLMESETKNPIFHLLPIGYQVRGMHIFQNHVMTNSQKMNILAEYVIRKAEDANYFESVNIYITDEEMPDLFLDIMNFHKDNGATAVWKK